MYYPVLRGKQNELLALRELKDENLLSHNIIPLIEPIKESSSFRIYLKSFRDSNRKIAVIQNSELASYTGFKEEEITAIKNSENFIEVYYVNNDSDLALINFNNDNNQHMIILGTNAEITNLESLRTPNLLCVINTDNPYMTADISREKLNNVIELRDYFHKEDRNQDYANNVDQLFSRDHLFYHDDGYIGFGDYSIIGDTYSDSGFAPKAVAIHIVYFDNKNILRIRHFVSDSNEDITNPAKKFSEALEKLIVWYDSTDFDKIKNDSSALIEFKKVYETKKYSGLGFIKKLSIKHHLEILGRFLDTSLK